MPEFSNDEINIMCIYDTGTRQGLIGELKEMLGYLAPDEKELLGYTDSALQKLESMTDAQYAALAGTLVPDFDRKEHPNDG